MRQKAGPGLPLHLPILYRKENSNSSGGLSLALGSGFKGFLHADFGRVFDDFFVRTRSGFLGAGLMVGGWGRCRVAAA
jgi:hypothetical protein